MLGMADILAPLKTALEIVKKLKEVSDKMHDAELKNLIGDLSLELADIKVKLADVTNENIDLKAKVKQLETAEGDPCPSCRKRTWTVVSSKPHPVMGELGAYNRTYKCSSCQFSEVILYTAR